MVVGKWVGIQPPNRQIIHSGFMVERVNPEVKRKAQLFSGLTLDHKPAKLFNGLVVVA